MKKFLIGTISAITVFMLSSCSTSKNGSETFTLSQTANGSSGSYWEYTLSTDNVIKEIDYYETSIIGPGYRQYWIFEITGEGEVTINWLAYEGDSYSEKNSYGITYFFDDEGKRTVISEQKDLTESDTETND